MQPLPAPVAAYFAANPLFDVEAMLGPFAPDAVVRDERREHVGRAAIRAWIEEATVAARAVATPTGWRREGEACMVEAEVAGAFSGSPVSLLFRFELRDDAIATLEIS